MGTRGEEEGGGRRKGEEGGGRRRRGEGANDYFWVTIILSHAL